MIKIKEKSVWSDAWRRLKRDRKGMVSLIIVLCYALIALLSFAGILASDWKESVGESYAPPALNHLFGTDIFGRSVLRKVIHASQVAMSVGLISSICAVCIGVTLGSIAGYFGKWIDELIWREFYKNIMHSFPRVSMNQPFNLATKKIPWRFEQNEFEAWKLGKTGFPLIDAAMHQLINEGWMHNRLRMVVAMFFTKNLLHDWRLGEAYFMNNLIDGDFASNNGGWQWSASTGTDAAPYFRIFNPVTQSQNFDPQGEFIKQHLPQLEALSAKEIHLPPTVVAIVQELVVLVFLPRFQAQVMLVVLAEVVVLIMHLVVQVQLIKVTQVVEVLMFLVTSLVVAVVLEL